MSEFYRQLLHSHFDRVERLNAAALEAGFSSWLCTRRNGGFWQVRGLREWRPEHCFETVRASDHSYRIPVPKVKAVLRWRHIA